MANDHRRNTLITLLAKRSNDLDEMEDGHQPDVVAEEHPLEAADGELDLPLPDHPSHEDGGGELTYDGEEPPQPPPHDEPRQESCCSKAAADAPSGAHLEAGGVVDHQQVKDLAPPVKRPRIEETHPGDVVWESLMGEFPFFEDESNENFRGEPDDKFPQPK